MKKLEFAKNYTFYIIKKKKKEKKKKPFWFFKNKFVDYLWQLSQWEEIHMSHVMRKPVFGVCDQVRHKPPWAVKEAR